LDPPPHFVFGADGQIEVLNAKRRETLELKAEEGRLMQERIDLDAMEARRREEEKVRANAAKMAAMRAHNEELRLLKRAAMETQMGEDLRLLGDMLERERRAEEKENRQKVRYLFIFYNISFFFVFSLIFFYHFF
jgi:hypothetical protein